jgi:hypothetical protein
MGRELDGPREDGAKLRDASEDLRRVGLDSRGVAKDGQVGSFGGLEFDSGFPALAAGRCPSVLLRDAADASGAILAFTGNVIA